MLASCSVNVSDLYKEHIEKTKEKTEKMDKWIDLIAKPPKKTTNVPVPNPPTKVGDLHLIFEFQETISTPRKPETKKDGSPEKDVILNMNEISSKSGVDSSLDTSQDNNNDLKNDPNLGFVVMQRRSSPVISPLKINDLQDDISSDTNNNVTSHSSTSLKSNKKKNQEEIDFLRIKTFKKNKKMSSDNIDQYSPNSSNNVSPNLSIKTKKNTENVQDKKFLKEKNEEIKNDSTLENKIRKNLKISESIGTSDDLIIKDLNDVHFDDNHDNDDQKEKFQQHKRVSSTINALLLDENKVKKKKLIFL